mmetsp:Transcript_14504/g.39982  ORF Transcript_14504/g.39982 Transcript_14504/m.39982 type:complete len:102 (+) Transcript_14504:292-597(+)
MNPFHNLAGQERKTCWQISDLNQCAHSARNRLECGVEGERSDAAVFGWADNQPYHLPTLEPVKATANGMDSQSVWLCRSSEAALYDLPVVCVARAINNEMG